MDLSDVLADYATLPEYQGQPGPGVNSRSAFGGYPIHVAAVRGSVEELSLLLEAGADIDQPGEHGFTPLHEAALCGHNAAVRFLLEKGASREICNDDGETALQLARLMQESEIAVLLQTL